MEVRHLTDEELQDYLDGNPPSVNKIVEEHLKKCRLCQEALEEYKRLYGELEDYKGYELPPDFAKMVLSKLSEEPILKPKKSYAGIFWTILSLVLGVSLMLYLGISTKLGEKIMTLAIKQIQFLSVSLSSTGQVLEKLNVNFSLLFFSGIILLIIGLLDYVISHKKVKSNSFFSNCIC